MARHDDLDAHFAGPLHDRVKLVHLEPKQYTVSVWFIVAIADRTVMMFHLEAVQLKNNLAIEEQLLVGGAAVTALAAQQALIPSATGFHIGYGD